MDKLSKESTHLMESDDDDEQILFEHTETKVNRRSDDLEKGPTVTNSETPINYGKKFRRKTTPIMSERSVPTLHSNIYKYK
jgi:hypothetical protein